MKLWSLVKLWLLSLPERREHFCWQSRGIYAAIFCLGDCIGLERDEQCSRDRPSGASNRSTDGLRAGRDEFERALEQSALTLRALSYPRTEGSQAGAKLQQSLRGFAEDAGLIVNGSQLLVAEDLSDTEEEAFELLSVDLSLQGMPSALDAFLDEVRLNTPRLAVSKLDLVKPRRPRQRRGEPAHNPEILNVRMTVVGLREL